MEDRLRAGLCLYRSYEPKKVYKIIRRNTSYPNNWQAELLPSADIHVRYGAGSVSRDIETTDKSWLTAEETESEIWRDADVDRLRELGQLELKMGKGWRQIYLVT